MAPIKRILVQLAVELDVDVHVTEREVREFVATGIDTYRASLPQWHKLASTPKVKVLSYRKVGQKQ